LKSFSADGDGHRVPSEALLDAVENGEHQFGFDGLGIGDGVDAAFDMGDVVVLEAAQDVGDRVAFADVGEELVAEALALGGAFDQARDVHEGHAGGDDLFGFADLGKGVKASVGHVHLADVRLDGAEREVRGLGGGGAGERVEKRGFADVRQSDDPGPESHSSLFGVRRASASRTGGGQAKPWSRADVGPNSDCVRNGAG